MDEPTKKQETGSSEDLMCPPLSAVLVAAGARSPAPPTRRLVRRQSTLRRCNSVNPQTKRSSVIVSPTKVVRKRYPLRRQQNVDEDEPPCASSSNSTDSCQRTNSNIPHVQKELCSSPSVPHSGSSSTIQYGTVQTDKAAGDRDSIFKLSR